MYIYRCKKAELMVNKTIYRIVQISDTHITPGHGLAEGIDTWRNFERLIADLEGRRIDHVVLSGDLANDPLDIEPYEYIRISMEKLGFEYSVIAGNHDKTALMKEAFPETAFHGGLKYYHKTLGPLSAAFLDTSAGSIHEPQLRWFERAYVTMPEPRCIFMHHPPVYCGVPLMDTKYPLKNMDELQSILRKTDRPSLVFCGHYHVEKTVLDNCCTVFVTPSAWYQLRQDTETWGIDHTRVGYRMIELTKNELRTTVRYIE